MEQYLLNEMHKELDLIQGCVNRMASNSFHIKGWAIGLISIIISLSFSKQNKEPYLYFLMAAIVIIFWVLDAYFLKLENQYRELYKWVIQERSTGKNDKMYDLDPSRFSNDVKCMWCTIFSKTLIPLYGILFLLIISLYAFNK